MKKSVKIFSSTMLKNRGWTKSMRVKFLKSKDQIKKVYPSGYYIIQYKAANIEKIELNLDFQLAKAKGLAQGIAIMNANAKRLQLKYSFVENMLIDAKIISMSDLLKMALDNYNSFKKRQRIPGWEPIDEFAAKDLLDEIQVNTIRHKLTPYNKALSEASLLINVNDARKIIRQKVFDAIATAYPCFTDECNRQLLNN